MSGVFTISRWFRLKYLLEGFVDKPGMIQCPFGRIATELQLWPSGRLFKYRWIRLGTVGSIRLHSTTDGYRRILLIICCCQIWTSDAFSTGPELQAPKEFQRIFWEIEWLLQLNYVLHRMETQNLVGSTYDGYDSDFSSKSELLQTSNLSILHRNITTKLSQGLCFIVIVVSSSDYRCLPPAVWSQSGKQTQQRSLQTIPEFRTDSVEQNRSVQRSSAEASEELAWYNAGLRWQW